MNKNNGILIALLLATFLVGCAVMYKYSPYVGTDQKDVAKGRLIISVTDAAADMANISEINLQLDSVEIHNAATNMWTKVSTSAKAYNLLSLNTQKRNELLVDVEQEVGTYDKIRFELMSAAVMTKKNGTQPATFPTGGMQYNTKIMIRPGETSSVSLDFQADKSLFTTAKGEYVFAPVLTTESKSNITLNFGENNAVLVTNGTVEDKSTIGMDLTGGLKLDFKLSPTQKIDLNADRTLKLAI